MKKPPFDALRRRQALRKLVKCKATGHRELKTLVRTGDAKRPWALAQGSPGILAG